MKDTDFRIGNKRISLAREQALAALSRAKELERSRIESGYEYVRIDDKTLKLVKRVDE